MLKHRTNPYELGKLHAEQGMSSTNPYETFSAKWGEYNRGYNSIANPWMTDSRKG